MKSAFENERERMNRENAAVIKLMSDGRERLSSEIGDRLGLSARAVGRILMRLRRDGVVQQFAIDKVGDGWRLSGEAVTILRAAE